MRKVALQHFQRLNGEHGVELAVHGVEMRNTMFRLG